MLQVGSSKRLQLLECGSKMQIMIFAGELNGSRFTLGK